MQSMLNLCATYGLPLCVSGITLHPNLSKEMADHDLRRKASNLKRHRSQTREGVHANQEMGRQRSLQILLGEIKGEVDLASVLHDLSYSDLDLTAAKAA